MRHITDRMIQQGKDEERLKLEAPKPAEVIIDATKGDTDAESLEIVQPPPADDPSAFH